MRQSNHLQKKMGINMNKNQIVGKKVGTISVSMYEESETGLPLFYVQAENKHVLPISHTIENTLNKID